MKYKAVIFDLFGTLVDNFTTSEYNRILQDMADILQVPADKFSKLWKDSFYMRTNGTHKTHEESIRWICNELGKKVTDEQVEKVATLRLDYTVRTLQPRKDAIPTIKKIKAMGLKVGLLSDCSPETPAAWPKTPFNGIFDVTIFSCEVNTKKPDPRIYRMATDKLGVKPEECLYVGDGSSHELTGATAVGMHPVQIIDPRETIDTHYVDREENWTGPRISNLREVLKFIV
jgi:putative hydrolase of the HAD superfamily